MSSETCSEMVIGSICAGSASTLVRRSFACAVDAPSSASPSNAPSHSLPDVQVSERSCGRGCHRSARPFLARVQPKRGMVMDLETLTVAVFCLVDDFVCDLCRECQLRQRGPAPVLADNEVLTVEIVGEFLGLDTDRGLHAHFRRYFGHLFPGLRRVHRTTFARQAANLWATKDALWRRLAAMAGHAPAMAGHDPAVTLIDSMPVPVCRFARAHRCRSLRDLSAFGYDPVAHRTYYCCVTGHAKSLIQLPFLSRTSARIVE